MLLLDVQNVRKSFKNTLAVDNVSFTVDKGKMFGLLGPNGAGKTTLIRMITNIYEPDDGNILMFGDKVGPKQQNNIGYLPEERGLYKKLTVMEQLSYFGQLKGLSKSDAISRAKQWLIKFNAADWAGKKIQELSKGMQQKVQFIATVIHDPDMLILDEPFSGFDPVNADMLKEILLEMRNSGKTILISTHIMEQAEKLCDDILLINNGKVVLSGGFRSIKSSFGKDTVIMEFDGNPAFLEQYDEIDILSRSLTRIEFRIKGDKEISQKILKEAMEHLKVYKYELVEPSLHEIFIEVVSRKEEQNEPV